MSRTLHVSVLLCILGIYTLNAQSPQALPFSQNWSNTALITTNDIWTGVPGIIGYRGDDITGSTGADPQSLLGEGTITIDVIANQTNPNTNSTGGVAEFEITDAVVALQGSGTADAPNIIIAINTICMDNIQLSYNVRDIDGSSDNAIQQVALQYRIGNTGNFTNIPAGYIADATIGPSLATLVTPILVTLPTACENQANVQIRIITSNAVGNDEWVGIDDINISGTSTGPTAAVISGNGVFCGEGNLEDVPVLVSITGDSGSYTVYYTDGVNDYTDSGSSPVILTASVNFTSTYTLDSVKFSNGCSVPFPNLSGSAFVEILNCNPTCDITNSGLTDVHCEDNNETSDDTDDFIWFQLNPTGTNISGAYSVSVFPGSILLNGTDPAENVPYGVSSFFRLQQGSAGIGNFSIFISDTLDSDCVLTDTIVNPGSCSQMEPPAYTYDFIDPCSCNNDTNFGNNTGTFNDQIVITGTAGSMLSLTCLGCNIPLTLTENPAGTYTSNVFSHIDGIGYTAYIFDGNILIDSIKNICAYPNVFIENDGPYDNCTQPGIELEADISDNGVGTSVWSGTGVTMDSIFNPSGLAPGGYLITLTYTGDSTGNVSLDGITPAYPGCIATDTSTFVVIAPSIPNAGNGGSVCSNVAFPLNATGVGTWTGGVGIFSNPNSPTSTYTPTGSEAGTTVILTWTDLNACLPGTDTVWIIVLPFPTANAGPDQNVCFGPVTLAATGNGTGTWSGGAGSFNNINNPSATYNPASSEQGTTVNLTWTVTNSCSGTNDAVAITFAPNQAIITYIPSTVCTNSPPINPTLGPGSMNGVYTYTGAGTLALNTNSGQINPAASTPGTYIVTNTFTPPIGSGPSLMLLGALDGPLTGGTPKCIKLAVLNNIPDLSIYGVENLSNGTASAGIPDFTFPAVAITAGTIIYIASEIPNFTAWFGFAPTYVNGVANNNGDDGILLYTSGVVSDALGVIGQIPPTAGSWNYLDGWIHRKSGRCPSVVFNLADWDLSGANALDDDALNTNATSTPVFPAGSYASGNCVGTTSCPSSDTARITIRLAPLPNAGGGTVICGIGPVSLSASGGVGTWSGGAGTFTNNNSPNTIYNPALSELGKNVKLNYRVVDQICGTVADTFRLTILVPPLSAQYTYQSNEFCPNGDNPVVSHTTGVDGIYRVTTGNAADVDLNNLTGEIELTNTIPGTYTITNNVYACGNLMITGVIDGPLVGGVPKAVELYVIEDIADLSIYGLGVANNGGGSDGIEFTFPEDFAAKGSYIYVSSTNFDFNTYFGFAPDYVSNQIQVNGDDAVELFCSGYVIDVFGNINQSGTGLSWEYMDGWAYRKNNSNIDGFAFNPSDWNYSGPNALDNSTTNANAIPPFPLGTFTTNAIPICSPNTFSQTIFIGDDEQPTITCPNDIVLNLEPGECGEFVFLPEPTVEDNCPGNITLVQTEGPLNGEFVHKDDSPFTITWEATDFFGNGPVSCSYQLSIVEFPFPSGALVCNDQVNLSLDNICNTELNADVILEGGPYGCYEEYLVSVSGQATAIITHVGVYTITITDPTTGNSCWGILNVEDKLPPVITCEQPMCDLSELRGEWETTDPTFDPEACWAFDGFIPLGGSRYDVIEFSVSVAGDYTFTMTDNLTFDGIAAIYNGTFDPNDNCINLLAGDDDLPGIFESEPSFTVNLQPGSYILVSTTWATNQLGEYMWTFTGPSALQIPCEFKCYELDNILSGFITLPEPTVQDCSPVTNTQSSFLSGNDDCDTRFLITTYIVTDGSGNSSSCTTEVAINPLTLADVVLPPSLIIMNCGTDYSPEGVSAFFDIDSRSGAGIGGYNDDWTEAAGSPAGVVELNEGYAFGYPHYFATGRDGNLHAQKIDNSVCNIFSAYSDLEIPACGVNCGGNTKVIRTWTLLDWCALEAGEFLQLIKAVDLKAPTFIVKDVTVSVNPWGCVANFDVPNPWELQDNCDAHPSWTVQGPAGVSITYNPATGIYKASGVPKGVHQFLYKAWDCCGNESFAFANVTVIDRSAPVAVAKQNIVISLTGSGTGGDGAAKLYAYHVDNGSYDHCSAVRLEIRRPAGAPDCGNLGIDDHNNNVTFDDDDSASPNVRWAHPEDDRDDTDNGEYVKFCCEDLAGTTSAVHQAILRVWDDGNMNGVIGDNLIIDGMQDNYNETWADIRVEDKLPPTLVCPDDVTVTCDMDINISEGVWVSVDGVDMTMTGGPAVAYALCSGNPVEYRDVPTWTNTCQNVGRVRREFRSVKGATTVNCYQIITVAALPSTFVVTPPTSSIVDTDCDFTAADIKDSEKPRVLSGPCDVIGENIDIDTFFFEDGVCKKWRVTYEYINWCTGEVKAGGVKWYKYKDEEKPVLTCADAMFPANPNPQNPNGVCEGTVTLTASATDGGGCTDNGWLKWVVFIDLWGNGSIDLEYSSFLPTTDNNLGNDTNGNGIPDRYVAPTSSGDNVTIPAFVLEAELSVHKVTWKVTDGCGNFTNCSSTFMVVDKKAPTPYCVSLSSAVMENGEVELWAKDFDKGSFDNCTPQSNLLFTFNGEMPVWTLINVDHYFKGIGVLATAAEYAAGTAQRWSPSARSSAKIFDCDDVENSPVEVQMTVWDQNGNSDYCSVTLTLIDNQGGCDSGSKMAIAGEVITDKGDGIKGARIVLNSLLPNYPKDFITDLIGTYEFDNIPMNVDYELKGIKRDDWLNGISTLDLVHIQRHILDISRFDSPYKNIAADVNKDGKVTATDLVQLRKLILGLITELPDNNSWLFLDVKTSMNTNSPWPLDEIVQVSAINHDMMNENFIGVKIGDVNGNALANLENEIKVESRNKGVTFITEDKTVDGNQELSIVISAKDFNDITGFQFTMDLSAFEFVNIQSGEIEIEESNYGLIGNNLTFSWNENELKTIAENDGLFTLKLKAKHSGRLSEMLSINSEVTKSEIYSGKNYEVKAIALEFRSNESGVFALHQNEPNPFKTSTTFKYELPEASDVILSIMDVTGKVILTKQLQGLKDINTVELNRKEIDASGMIYYQIETKNRKAVKSMIVIE